MARIVRGVRLRVALNDDDDDDTHAISLARADLATTRRRERALESPNESSPSDDDEDEIRATLARAAEDARAMRDARDAYDDDREAVIATYRAETSCDRETASLACALVIHQRRIRDFTRGLEDMRAMGFDDEDGAASAALMRCDFDVRRAVETRLAASRT